MPIGVARDTGCKRVTFASLQLLLIAAAIFCAILFSGLLGGRDGGNRDEYGYKSKYYRGDVGVDGTSAAAATGATTPTAAFGRGEKDGSGSATKGRERRAGGDNGGVGMDVDSDGGSDGDVESDSSPSGLHLNLHPPIIGTVGAVYDLMDRVLKDPNAKNSFRLRIVNENDNGKGGKRSSSSFTQSWFRLEQQQKKTPDHHQQQPLSSIDNHNTATNADIDTDTTIVIAIAATSANELTAGLGYYFKHYCNFTLEWSTGGRAGGEHIVLPDVWPVPLVAAPGGPEREHEHETTVVRRRTTQLRYVPYSVSAYKCARTCVVGR